MRTRSLLLALAAPLAVVPAAQAQAPGLGQIVSSLPAAAPSGGGVVDAATGSAGGLLAGAAPGVAAALAHTLGARGGDQQPRPGDPPPAGEGDDAPALESGVLDFAVGSLIAAAPPIGSTVGVDGTPPSLRVQVVSTLRQVHRSGSLKLLVRLDEAGIVALGGTLRPGRRAAGTRGRHSRALIRVPPTLLAFRRRGALTVSVQLGRQARRTLRRSRSARLSVVAVASDAARNQTPARRRLHVKR